MKHIIALAAAVLVLVLGAGGSFVAFKQPAQQPPSEIRVELTPDRVARGRYLFVHQLACVGCHSTQDPTKWALPVSEASYGNEGCA